MPRDNVKLQLMGIQTWELTHPERLSVQPKQTLTLPQECELLFVSPVKPEKETALFYQKILKAMKLDIACSQHITPEQLLHLDGAHTPKWLWFAGDDRADERYQQLLSLRTFTTQPNQLTSPLLTNIDGNDAERRALWNQIRSYA
ncbi:DNA polymerase III subunit psi [Vibrio sp. 10N.261.51.F12]|uniref:DNA polymerase III subunit psi n=1 Tax=Vibrio sp. 10N.261.51.F12 TaxID=3229679 RepID=UPI00354C52C2